MGTARRAPRAHEYRHLRRCVATSGTRLRRARAGPIIRCLGAALGFIAAATPVTAQLRKLERYGAGSPEAKLMLYYSSAVAFSSLGVPYGVERPSSMAVAAGQSLPRIEASLELSYLPSLSQEQRTTGSDKPEATNLAPLFARPRVAARLPGGFGVELSWIPPFRVFDVKANLFAGALSHAFTLAERVRLVPRASVLVGRVEGPITCNRETAAEGNADLMTYFSFVCYSNDSEDFFEPRHLAGELLVARTSASGRWQPYLSAGARAERTQFDVGVIRQDGSRDRDQPVLEVETARAFGTAGASWLGLPHTRLAAELYYAPGSVFTARVLGGVRLW
jgi:hypothetical protein